MTEIIKKGNLFHSDCQILVNPVNCKGVSGAGLALIFKSKFPINYRIYRDTCLFQSFQSKKSFGIGKVLMTGLENGKYIANFPTKNHYSEKSCYEYISKGLEDLIQKTKDQKYRSIAIPALGCGLGGLDWNVVKQMIEKAFANSEKTIKIYSPN